MIGSHTPSCVPVTMAYGLTWRAGCSLGRQRNMPGGGGFLWLQCPVQYLGLFGGWGHLERFLLPLHTYITTVPGNWGLFILVEFPVARLLLKVLISLPKDAAPLRLLCTDFDGATLTPEWSRGCSVGNSHLKQQQGERVKGESLEKRAILGKSGNGSGWETAIKPTTSDRASTAIAA